MITRVLRVTIANTSFTLSTGALFEGFSRALVQVLIAASASAVISPPRNSKEDRTAKVSDPGSVLPQHLTSMSSRVLWRYCVDLKKLYVVEWGHINPGLGLILPKISEEG